jgi:hypothetical protein
MGTIAMINVVTGALIAFPLLLLGNAKLIKAKRLVSEADVSSRPAIAGASRNQLVTPQTSELSAITEHNSSFSETQPGWS